MIATRWEPPDIAQSDLAYTVTSSVLEQFAQGHSIGDVLRELVQNEYDAGGKSLSVTFGTDALEVIGTGRPIDRAGWRRLGVMLGTGRVVGDNIDVPQKTNGIGSKNHGLRSLFLIGDQIYVRSGGMQTVLDLHRGALREPRPDASSGTIPGAHLYVPYRSLPGELLEAYDENREAKDLGVLADELAATLVKLAHPDAPRSLRAVRVSSKRHDRVLTWSQTVKLVGRHRLGGPILERTIELRDGALSGNPALSKKVREREYQKSYPLPSGHRGRVFPDYFRVPGGRLRIGISLRLRRKLPDLQDAGAFYYPLGFAHGATGCAIGVSAPFEMNGDRSALVDPSTSSWNEWLMELAAGFALDLLTSDWLDTFQGSAYLAMERAGQPSVPHFAEALMAGLGSRECWATRDRVAGRRPRFAKVDRIKIGSSADLDAILEPGRTLAEPLAADSRILELARAAGAEAFTVASAIRLRCAGSDASHLATKLPAGATALHYTTFPEPLTAVDLQGRFAAALDRHRREVTAGNRADLRAIPTTLTAAGTLAAPVQPLWVVDDSVAAAAPVRDENRLHPALARYGVLRKLCQPFDTSRWAVGIALQAVAGTARPEDREALYAYLLRNPEGIKRGSWSALRAAPIVRDHRGEWVAAVDMVQPRAAGTVRLERVLHFPEKQIVRNKTLARALRIRGKVVGADLVRYAELVSRQPELADEFEETLHQLRHLLTRPTVAGLGDIACLRSTTGEVVAPREAYVRSAKLLETVGEQAAFAAGPHTSLHVRLRCRTSPLADDMIAFIDACRTAGSGPPAPETLYPALVDALRQEGRAASELAAEAILYHGQAWHAPADVLLGRKHRAIFNGALPVMAVGAVLEAAYDALGATREPASRHWRRFFEWIDDRSERGTRHLAADHTATLRHAYSKLASLPADVPARTHVFLDTTGHVHSKIDARALRFLINDDPRTAFAMRDAGLPVRFADLGDPTARRFYAASDVSQLTEVRRTLGVSVGTQRPSPPWFREDAELARLHQPDFARAVHALAVATGSRSAVAISRLRRKLRAITRIQFVSALVDLYKVGPHDIRVAAEFAADGDRLALHIVRSKSELHDLIARAVAVLAEGAASRQPALADSVYRLLACESDTEFARYLRQRGIAWQEPSPDSDIEEEADDDVDGRAQVAEALKAQLLQRRAPAAETPPTPAPPTHERQNGDAPVVVRTPLPPLPTVTLLEAEGIEWKPPERTRVGGGGGGGWRPRTAEEQQRDQELGRRGEELIYRAEMARVIAQGGTASQVVWAAQADPAADHDILSVDDDGEAVWIEVKSTTGRHGRFDWPRAEFELALRVRSKYILCRVFEADTESPSVVRDRDPICKLLRGEMRLDISSLAAEMAPMPESMST